MNNLNNYIIDYSLSLQIPQDILKQYMILPIKQTSLYILVATSQIDQDITKLNNIFKTPIKLIEFSSKYLEYEYQYLNIKQNLYNLANKAILNKTTYKDNIFILNFLDIVFKTAINNNISDIHFEALEDSFIIRFRIDGVLNQFFKFNKTIHNMLSSVLKFLAHLDISQKRLPLNGRFTYNIQKIAYDFRVSTMPTIYGESIVLRILDNKNIQKDLQSIGFETTDLDIIYKNLNLTQGLILVTGPTGSGKTTTLYSMLRYLNKSSKKIVTIEDPVEYKLDGIMQVNLNTDINLDYHTVLKNLLRQDPDILLIGEIRDTLSAKIAIRAALTGHLVIATLHTNNAIETITRLKDLNIEPYLIATTLKLVIAQRLVRKLCNSCKQYNKSTNLYEALGCSQCNLTGYKDRTIIAEFLQIDKTISLQISNNKNINLKDFISLQTKAYNLLNKGIISQEELLSKIGYEI